MNKQTKANSTFLFIYLVDYLYPALSHGLKATYINFDVWSGLVGLTIHCQTYYVCLSLNIPLQPTINLLFGQLICVAVVWFKTILCHQMGALFFSLGFSSTGALPFHYFQITAGCNWTISIFSLQPECVISPPPPQRIFSEPVLWSCCFLCRRQRCGFLWAFLSRHLQVPEQFLLVLQLTLCLCAALHGPAHCLCYVPSWVAMDGCIVMLMPRMHAQHIKIIGRVTTWVMQSLRKYSKLPSVEASLPAHVFNNEAKRKACRESSRWWWGEAARIFIKS